MEEKNSLHVGPAHQLSSCRSIASSALYPPVPQTQFLVCRRAQHLGPRVRPAPHRVRGPAAWQHTRGALRRRAAALADAGVMTLRPAAPLAGAGRSLRRVRSCMGKFWHHNRLPGDPSCTAATLNLRVRLDGHWNRLYRTVGRTPVCRRGVLLLGAAPVKDGARLCFPAPQLFAPCPALPSPRCPLPSFLLAVTLSPPNPQRGMRRGG